MSFQRWSQTKLPSLEIRSKTLREAQRVDERLNHFLNTTYGTLTLDLEKEKEQVATSLKELRLLCERHQMTSADLTSRLAETIFDSFAEEETLRVKLQKTLSQTALLRESLSKQKERKENVVAERLANESKNATVYKQLCGLMQLIRQTNDALRLLKSHQAGLLESRQMLEIERRVTFNELQELKGNLRVFCRVRPLLSSECGEPETKFLISDDGTELTVMPNVRAKSVARQTEAVFTFDKVFGPSASQEDVFDAVSGFVQSALDGFNVSLFAYGQTGSGKTHTMMGDWDPECLDKKSGVIPRALNLVFTTMRRLRTEGWSYDARLSVIEIYNESVRDLISGGEIRVDPSKSGLAILVGANWRPVSNTTEVLAVLNAAAKHRSVAATAANLKSSRSHCIVLLRIGGELKRKNEQNPTCFQSTLSLIDLAGSERLDRSQAQGDRLKEAQSINKSLSYLGEVIGSLSAKRAHIPFRNSKLTMLMKDSLGGSAKTLMFVNISPLLEHRNESICSLKFVSRTTFQ